MRAESHLYLCISNRRHLTCKQLLLRECGINACMLQAEGHCSQGLATHLVILFLSVMRMQMELSCSQETDGILPSPHSPASVIDICKSLTHIKSRESAEQVICWINQCFNFPPSRTEVPVTFCHRLARKLSTKLKTALPSFSITFWVSLGQRVLWLAPLKLSCP